MLELLLQQVEEQLNAVGEETAPGSGSLGGTKILTYYNHLIRGGINPLSRDGRELYLIAMVLDQMRVGNLGVASDALAARFMALHQASLDQHWDAARNLELYTPEMTSAAGSQITLKARKHSRLMDKVGGYYPDLRRRPGWGKGKGSPQWPQSDYTWESQGKKGKKGKGKQKQSDAWGKGKGRGGSGSWDGQSPGKGEKRTPKA